MLIFVHPKIFLCSVIFWTYMAHLWLGIGAKVSILVSRLPPKNLISRAYAIYTKTDKAEGLVVVLEGLKLICQEEKVVIVFCHPPKDELTEEFECWAIHRFAHISEEGDEQVFFNALNDGGDSNSGGVDGSQQNPNTIPNTTCNNTEEAQTNKPVPVEIAQLLESNASNSSTLDSDDAALSGRCSLAWLMMTINHCQRTFQHLLLKDRSQHNSFPTGSILGVASTALKVEGRTRHA